MTKVVYVVGSQRGGTTIAGRLMGELPGFAFFGEVRKLWQVGLAEARTCGCGLGYDYCEVWSAVLPHLLASTDIATIAQWQHTAVPDRLSSLRAWRLARVPAGRREPAVDSYASLLGATYAGLAAVTGANVVVDTSKLPADAVLVSQLIDVEPYIVQLVRDPRGTVYSNLSRSDRVPGFHLRRAVGGATGWLARHLAGAALRRRAGPERSLLLTYERLMDDPDGALAEVAHLVGEPAPIGPVVADGRAELGVAHTPIGNGRCRAATVRLARDDRWMTALGRGDRLVVSAVTQPLSRRFGYRFTTLGR